jgi:transcriptional regulator with XRE-family HTH domain
MRYDKIEIGNKLFLIRNSKNLKQIEVSEALGISQSTYSKIESGKYDITLSMLFNISEYFGVSIEWILGIKDNVELTSNESLEVEKFINYIISQRKQ